ncbi:MULTISPECIES: AhpC/TSA family protein [Prochlorococcus]|uniref:AhpC/TSA family protein n=1 Tax=Prochlorococcus TaxID=1218 RepID=UPI00053397E8|nr:MULTISPECIES: AhpC/TSA family protein [Prochlorococcus]KGG12395.1 hypothetical protein EV05_1607 [Prochlorococcus sp. MIT 0601]
MNNLSGTAIKEIIGGFFPESISSKLNLYILLGVFGDFDSIEYAQSLVPFLDAIDRAGIDMLVVGIGDEKAKASFSEYTLFPKSRLRNVSQADIHDKLGLEKGLKFTRYPFLNLLLMCTGIKSPGTIREVIRGYTGDDNANKLFRDDDIISFSKLIEFKAKNFKLISKKSTLRPFELSSLRLMNMIEVLSNWSDYIPNITDITQRGATFLIGEKDEILYSYKSKALLDFSERMQRPLFFLDNILNN